MIVGADIVRPRYLAGSEALANRTMTRISWRTQDRRYEPHSSFASFSRWPALPEDRRTPVTQRGRYRRVVPAGRPSIPTALRRAVLVEAGHRCAIPTCRAATTELAHIVPWASVHRHEAGNLIALCPTCHTRYDRREIDRMSMRQYKANLVVLSSRYGELERRVMQPMMMGGNPMQMLDS